MKPTPRTKRQRLSDISLVHYYKFAFRLVFFIAALAMYIFSKVNPDVFATTFNFSIDNDLSDLFNTFNQLSAMLLMIWGIEIFEMILRFFPSRFESMGCQKQFKCNYLPQEGAPPVRRRDTMRGVVLTGVVWILLIALLGLLHFCFPQIFDQGFLLLVCLFFSVCDMICILFFCPFQTWFMKNKCCGSCRIYNWDYLMMFSPLIFIRSWYTWTLLACSFFLFLRWEITAFVHPERFSRVSNAALSCANCPEKLCHHKKQLRRFLKKYYTKAKEAILDTFGHGKKKPLPPPDAQDPTTTEGSPTDIKEQNHKQDKP